MLIRCTHCNHELRVPDQQISATGTRVLCKSCNTIFVARRDAEAPARPPAELLPVADDPALEEALDRILDRGPLAEIAHGEQQLDELPSAVGDDRSGGSGASDPWAQVSPESLGISLVDDEPQDPGPQRATASTAQGPAVAGDDEVDELLDQVLRDLDRQQPASPPVAAPVALEPDRDDDLFAGLSLEEASDTVKPAAPATSAPPDRSGAPGLDLESILSEIRSEASAPPPTTRISPPSTTTSAGFDLGDDDFGDEPDGLGFGGEEARPARATTTIPGAGGAHEREQSLHDIYESDAGSSIPEAVSDQPAATMTDFASGTGALPLGSTATRPRPPAPPGHTGTVRTRTVTTSTKPKPAAPPSKAWIGALLAVVALAAAGGGGYWLWMQRKLAESAASADNPAVGMPSFTFEQQDGQLVKVKGGLAYVVTGVVRNTSSFAVYIIRVTGVLRGADGQEVARAASYAGNTLDTASLSKVPKAEVLATLDTRIGEGGMNVKIDPSASVPFTLVFWDAPSDARNPELSASARSFPGPATPDG